MKRICELTKLLRPFLKKNISLYAAGASFYLFLSILPASAMLLSIVPYLPIPDTFWKSAAGHLIPEAFLTPLYSLREYIFRNKSLTTLSLSAFTTLWSASKGVLFIMDGLNAALSLKPKQNYFYRRFLAIVYFLLLALGAFVILMVVIFGQRLLNLFHIDLSALLPICGAYILLTFLFTLIYFLLPIHSVKLKHCLRSSVFSATGWLLFSWLYSIYVNLFPKYTQLYGIIGLLVLAAVWLRVCISVLLYGGILTRLFSEGTYQPVKIIKAAVKKKDT